MTTLPQKSNYRSSKPVQQVPSIQHRGPSAGMAADPGMSMTVNDVLRIFRASIWWMVIIMTVAVVSGAAAYVLLLRYSPKYESRGMMEVSQRRIFDPNQQVLQATANRETIDLEQRTHAELMMQESLFSRVLERDDRVRGTSWFASFDGDMEAAKRNLVQNFKVVPLPGRRLVQVTMEAPNGADAQIIAEAIGNLHIRDRQDSLSNEILNRSRTLNSLISALNTQRASKAALMRDLITDLNIGGGGVPGSITPKELELADHLKRELETRALLATAQSQLDAVTQRLQAGEDPPAVLARVDSDPMVLNYRQQIDAVDMELATRSSEQLGEHAQTTLMRKRRDVLQEKLYDVTEELKGRTRIALLDELQGAVAGSQAMLQQLETRIKEIQNQLGELKTKQARYVQLVQEDQNLANQLSGLEAQVTQIRNVQNQSEGSGVQWYPMPQLPAQPSFPTIPLVMSMAIGFGLLLSLGLAFLRELLNTTVRSTQDIARVGQMTVLGVIPDEADDPEAADIKLPLAIAEAPESIIADHLRQVRTRLQQATSLDTTRSILVTSADPDDGKTVIACNLAAGLALNGRRILLVDCNFRKPSLHNIFEVSNKEGFSNVLSSPEVMNQYVRETEVPNLMVLPSGPKPANATELLESQLLIDFIEQALEDYDQVIFDSGPLLFVSDAVALAPRVDGVITVLRAKRSTRGVLQRTREVLRQLKAEHIGVVLNGVRSHGGGYYRRNIQTYYAYTNSGEGKALAKRK